MHKQNPLSLKLKDLSHSSIRAINKLESYGAIINKEVVYPQSTTLMKSLFEVFDKEVVDYVERLIKPIDNEDWHIIRIDKKFEEKLLPNGQLPIMAAQNTEVALSFLLDIIEENRIQISSITKKDHLTLIESSNDVVATISKINFSSINPKYIKRTEKTLKGTVKVNTTQFAEKMIKMPGIDKTKLMKDGSFSVTMNGNIIKEHKSYSDGGSLILTPSSLVELLKISISPHITDQKSKIKQGHWQEALAAYFNIESWNHLIAKSNGNTVNQSIAMISIEGSLSTHYYKSWQEGIWHFCKENEANKKTSCIEVHPSYLNTYTEKSKSGDLLRKIKTPIISAIRLQTLYENNVPLHCLERIKEIISQEELTEAFNSRNHETIFDIRS